MKNRSRTEIVYQILEIVRRAGNGAGKTKIMYSALLSSAQLKEYLNVLTESDLLRYDSAMRMFKITGKGVRFLEIYNRIGDVIEEQQQTHVQA